MKFEPVGCVSVAFEQLIPGCGLVRLVSWLEETGGSSEQESPDKELMSFEPSVQEDGLDTDGKVKAVALALALALATVPLCLKFRNVNCQAQCGCVQSDGRKSWKAGAEAKIRRQFKFEFQISKSKSVEKHMGIRAARIFGSKHFEIRTFWSKVNISVELQFFKNRSKNTKNVFNFPARNLSMLLQDEQEQKHHEHVKPNAIYGSSSAKPVAPSFISGCVGWLGIGTLLNALLMVSLVELLQGKCWSLGNDKSLKPKSRANICRFYDFLLHLSFRTNFILRFSLSLGFSLSQYFREQRLCSGSGPLMHIQDGLMTQCLSSSCHTRHGSCCGCCIFGSESSI
ncbi:hypothetical protein RND71_027722 [Anisodus tanguticus]|uniref:Uncharacterized protein n=1 Tax=Anisodus tanguticus TaxID=243964 RepID=A0AAE1RJC5_9SOLA|nr:hypothetical protein RND71_027722 [Anisodus tanguticus]